jgi:hypothetical protein
MRINEQKDALDTLWTLYCRVQRSRIGEKLEKADWAVRPLCGLGTMSEANAILPRAKRAKRQALVKLQSTANF